MLNPVASPTVSFMRLTDYVSYSYKQNFGRVSDVLHWGRGHTRNCLPKPRILDLGPRQASPGHHPAKPAGNLYDRALATASR